MRWRASRRLPPAAAVHAAGRQLERGLISSYRTPALFEAARVTLTQRGDVSTGWSMGWKVNFWARMQDGNHAYQLLTEQLRLRASQPGGVNESGGTYPNLLDAHPPFQIDGNFGCTAGLAELFVQSYDGTLDLLPALPDAWPTGEVTGLVARGGYVVDLAWDKGRLTRARITSRLGGNCRVRVHQPVAAAGGTGRQPQPILPDLACESSAGIRKNYGPAADYGPVVGV